MRLLTLLPSILALAILLTPGPCFADETPADVCIERSFKKVKVVTPFSLTHRPKSKTVLLDDIVCGLQWRDKQCTTGQLNFDSNAKVYDYYTSAPITINEAVFVQSPTEQSPMGSGLTAFVNDEEAEQYLADKGPGHKMTFQELLKSAIIK